MVDTTDRPVCPNFLALWNTSDRLVKAVTFVTCSGDIGFDSCSVYRIDCLSFMIFVSFCRALRDEDYERQEVIFKKCKLKRGSDVK